MFVIKSDKTIQMNTGDDVYTPVFINKGTKLEPIRYSFGGKDVSQIDMVGKFDADIDFDKWMNTVVRDGEKVIISNKYVTEFTYTNTGWILSTTTTPELIDLDKYGIAITAGEPEINNTITVSMDIAAGSHAETCVTFEVLNINQNPNKPPIIRKEIYPVSNTILTFIKGQATTVKTDRSVVNSEGDVVIFIDAEDTEGLNPGKYVYQLKANIWDDKLSTYKLSTLTNKHKFYLVDDDYSDRDWFN